MRLFLSFCLLLAGATAAFAAPATTKPDFARNVRPFLTHYCSGCHNSKNPSAGLNLDLLQSSVALQQHRERVLEVVHALETKAMPAKGAPQPADAARASAIAAIKYELENFDFTKYRNPGYLPLHRLSATQYRNTIRDLIGVGEEIADDLPADESTHGFDHIAEAQDISAAHLEQYLVAARYVLDRAFLPPAKTQRFEAEKLPYSRLFGMRAALAPDAPNSIVTETEQVLIRDGGVVFNFNFPHTGLYKVKFRAWGEKVAANERGRGEPRLTLKLDTHKVAEPRIALNGQGKWSEVTAQVVVRSGLHDVKLEMSGMGQKEGETEIAKRFNRIGIDYIEVIGPVPEDETKYAKLRSDLLVAVPAAGVTPRQAARKVLDRFVPLAFRRPARPGEVERVVAIFDRVWARSKAYEPAVKASLEAVLTSPHFLLHVEQPRAANAPYRVNDYELANRLSYFLWASMPDAELFQVAAQNKLHEPEVLRAQTARMLKDPKSVSLAEKFAPQWLALGSLFAIHKEGMFHENNLSERQMIMKEINLIFDSVVREDRSIFDLIDADYTFVDNRLAKHYGIEGVTTREWQRVKLEGPLRQQRGGLLTTAGVLLAHSQSYHTNPSGRGRFILDSILGTPPPPPPPSVKPLDKPKKDDPIKLTIREKLSQHRTDPACSGCHAKIDPIGFALENYDVVGKWRTVDAGKPVDASGQLPGAAKPFNGPAELKQLLLTEKKDLLVRNFSKKMLTYALRRGVEFYDEATIRQAQQALAENEYRISALIHSIVRSYPFQYRQNPVSTTSSVPSPKERKL